MNNIDDIKVKCANSCCEWHGTHGELVKKKNKKRSIEHGLESFDYVCPDCGCDEHYGNGE